MFKILSYLGRKEWTMIFVAVIFIVTQVWLDLQLPEYMGTITTLVTSGGDISEVLRYGSYMVMCALGSLATAVVVGYLAAKMAASHAQTLRSRQFEKVDSFSMTEINKFSTASLITRSTNDVTQVQMIVTMGLQIVVKAPILAVWALIRISNGSMEWTMAMAVAIIIMITLFAAVILLVIPKFKKMQSLTDDLNRVVRENLTGLPVVRAYNAEGYQEGKFEDANKELTDTQLYTSRAMAVMMPAIALIMNLLLLSIYWIGAILIDGAGMMQRPGLFSDMIVFSSYSMQILMAFMMIAMLFIMLPRAQVAAKRINEVLDTEPSIIDGNITETDHTKHGEIEFRDVSFRYRGAANHVLENINFKVEKGETAAFIGSTGSGKSTLINLIIRFYDVTEGAVLVDGIDVRDYKLETLHDKIGYVPQKAVLFSGTVKSNVAFGVTEEQIEEEEVREAVRIAQGKEFVELMDGAYDASVSRGGTNVSGGQKQRLSIARAVAKRPEIYVFDDSFSALDYKTDRNLRTVLKKETHGATSIIVAQRIGTIMDADKIIVLDEGRVVGIGRHKELLETCEVYKDIAMSQLSEKELGL
ncbi:MAG: ABC transporter ATP-binding protein/permease [Methanomassiliicoccaceae archaeon]|nr:ABC transporter ATP-binding protein/permease [Methanomassiliicoccaceae archaeon]